MSLDRSSLIRDPSFVATPLNRPPVSDWGLESQDRRKGRRYRISIRVDYGNEAEKRRGTVYNIGAGGIFIRTLNPLEPGSGLEMTIYIAGGGFVFADGQVTWTNLVEADALPAGMGVRFVRIDPVDRLRLEGHLESL